jgi:hypothetical protein
LAVPPAASRAAAVAAKSSINARTTAGRVAAESPCSGSSSFISTLSTVALNQRISYEIQQAKRKPRFILL